MLGLLSRNTENLRFLLNGSDWSLYGSDFRRDSEGARLAAKQPPNQRQKRRFTVTEARLALAVSSEFAQCGPCHW